MNKGIAIIPARGGSKRLPRKNIRLLNGKPLIYYTLEAVKQSKLFSKIILSSDDVEILELGSKVDGITIEKRDKSLAEDNVKVIDLVKKIASREVNHFDYIGLFLPTCPFRTSKHIVDGFKLLTRADFSVVSTTEMQDPIQLSMTIGNNNIANPEAILNPSPLVTGNTRSQDFEKYYRVNGGFYISWLDKFVEKDNFFQGPIKALQMSNLHSVDIDYELDFKWAEYLLKNKYITL